MIRLIVLVVAVAAVGIMLVSFTSRNKILKSAHHVLPLTDDEIAYRENLNKVKAQYPFKKWRASYSLGLTQYTEANCNKMQKIFDDLIAALIAKGTHASEKEKVELFHVAIEKTNKLDDEVEGLIETGEREDLCDLTNAITVACGLNPKNYGEGEGLASEWREW